ncbi:MAG: ribonuclease Y [Clostridiales bacterium]|nr:MAG: ribonuclease Y [Clostridiales bacterium]
MSQLQIILTVVIVAVIVGFAMFVAGFLYRKKVSEKQIGSAKEEAKRIINDAIKTAETRKKEALLEAKEELLKERTDQEKELKERRVEVTRQEKRLQQREEILDKKYDNIDRKEEVLAEKQRKVEQLQEEVENVKKSQIAVLERISGYTADAAKAELLHMMDSELEHEYAQRISEHENHFKEQVDERSKHLLSLAIQKCAADHVVESTVSVVALPSDEMKGRIIGREGRNIRALETITGVDLIIDDTPEAITLSSFDPIRREVARQTLEKLISDGRIHPARIEETVEKVRRDLEVSMKKEGERATFETGVHGLHPDLIKLLGRQKYRTSYGQNVLNHSIEVSQLSGLLAAEIGADITLAKRAGLLHDIGKSVDFEMEGSHIQIGVDIAKKYKENETVVHAIAAHHGDVETVSVYDAIVQAADAISAARPGARRENLENYIKRLEKLEEIANSFPGVEKTFAIQAGREIRIMVNPEKISDDKLTVLSHDIVKKIESELEYPGQIKVHLIRESRAIDFAK